MFLRSELDDADLGSLTQKKSAHIYDLNNATIRSPSLPLSNHPSLTVSSTPDVLHGCTIEHNPYFHHYLVIPCLEKTGI